MPPEYADLAPQILRQRLVVEGYPAKAIGESEIRDYLSKLSEITRMTRLLEPVTHKSDLYGWAGWIHWETSGAHFYAWEKPLLFFSVDIYTCKQFDPKLVVDFTRDYFQASDIAAKDFSSSSAPDLTLSEKAPVAPADIARYTLSDADLDKLSRKLLAEQPPKVTDALIVYRLDGTDELSNLARHIEREVFEETFGNDEGQMRQIYGLYEDVSTFFLAMDQLARRPVGALRAMRPRADLGFLTLREAEKYAGVTPAQFQAHHGLVEEADWADRTVDWGTLAVPKRHRAANRHLLAAVLFRAGQVRSCLEGARHYIMLADAELHRTFDMMGFPFAALAGTGAFSYEGSAESALLYGRPGEFFAAMEGKCAETTDKRLGPILRAFVARFVHGVGVDHRFMFEFAVGPGVRRRCRFLRGWAAVAGRSCRWYAVEDGVSLSARL
ncbi:hypothetical protein PG997_010691 [Apiospora hydei]|uniref:Uncharacterized protein n=1 Tax=Apiospora hydei TaxID=1337664 RepID=A0ABR1VKU8_9PEZI